MKNLKFNEKGLIPAIVQDADTGEVLMLGYMDEEALRLTLSGDDVWFFSRRRQELWRKGDKTTLGGVASAATESTRNESEPTLELLSATNTV